MLCLKAEGVGRDMYAGVILPVNLGSSLQKAMRRGGGGGGGGSLSSSSPSYSAASGDGSSAACSRFSEDVKSIDGGKGTGRGQKMCNYRFQLEQEVQILQKQLQEEIDLHVALATAVGHSTMPLLNSPSRVPDKAQELLANIAALEITVSKLEEELTALHFQLSRERNERRLAETHLKYLPSLPLEPPSLSMEPLCSTSGFMWEEHISSLRASKFSGCQMSPSMKLDFVFGNRHSLLATSDRTFAKCPIKEESDSCGRSIEEKETSGSLHQTVATDQKKSSSMKNLWQHPNQLSEEMVRCMRNIFLCLSESSGALSKLSASQCLPSPSSPAGHLSRSSLTSVSDSSLIISSVRSPSTELHDSSEDAVLESSFDPYRVNRKVNWRNIGSYSLAAEVSWMSVGKAELEYAAEALKKFRFLVEQLAEVNPSQMSNDEKLAFWINLYNALIMHAYLAYGIPRSDIKLFSLMQKASYTIGGQSFSAADIEFVILKMKPPTHRPQIALVLAIHKFKISEEHRKYSIDSPEPLVMFALSCGMYSAPAVRIFTAQHVHDELQKSMRDYIQASVGISDKGKLLVPKLLHCFAKGVVEDSLLVDWICRYLTPDQVTVVRDSTSQRKQRLLGVRSFSILPFDLRFRYLFLPDSRSSHDIIPTYGASIGRLAEI